MRSRALASPFGGAPRRGRAAAFISSGSCRSDFSLDKVTDLYVTFKWLTGKSLYRRTPVRAIQADTLSGYAGLRQVDLPKPQRTNDKALVHITAAGVTPLDHTILSGGHPRAKAPLVLGNEGAGVIEDAGSAGKAARARELGFNDVVDLTTERLADGVRRITAGKGVDIVIESIGGAVTSEALSSLGLGGVLITLGYSAGRKTTIDVTVLIWKGARMAGFSLFAQSPTAIATAWRDIVPLIVGGSVKPIVERVYPLGEAGEALRHLTEDRPFGKVVLAGGSI